MLRKPSTSNPTLKSEDRTFVRMALEQGAIRAKVIPASSVETAEWVRKAWPDKDIADSARLALLKIELMQPELIYGKDLAKLDPKAFSAKIEKAARFSAK